VPVTDKKIGVLMGGTSAEREVSLKSGAAVLNALKSLHYNVTGIDAGPDICEVLKRERIEIAFIILHGGFGEDGSIQGLLEVLGIPYTGSGVLASSLAMDKEASKKVFLYHNIPVAPFVAVRGPKVSVSRSGEGFTLTTDCAKTTIPFGMPWVIKPATEGSSIGVSIVKDEPSFVPALDGAMRFGGRVLIEKFMPGKEIQVGILNEQILGAVEVRPKLEFYSYEAKYTPGMTEYILPPEVAPEIMRNAEKIALAAHCALDCRGATRVDLIVDDEGNSSVLEVNTIPGMTETSLLPKIAKLYGLDFGPLLEAILKEALSRRGK
jgi:D-alanine-D-alanine ligase